MSILYFASKSSQLDIFIDLTGLESLRNFQGRVHNLKNLFHSGEISHA